MTRRSFLTISLRTVLLTMLLPFLPPVVSRIRAEIQLDGSVLPAPLDNKFAHINIKEASINTDPFTYYWLANDGTVFLVNGMNPPVKISRMYVDGREWRADSGHEPSLINVNTIRVYPEVHDRKRREQEVKEMSVSAKSRGAR